MFTTIITTKFKRDVKRCEKQGKNMSIFKQVAKQLVQSELLSSKYKDHALTGNWKGHRDCHLEPDWLLIYKIDTIKKELIFVRMGSHAELFNM